MPYISTENVKRIRDAVKTTFPEMKFSIRQSGHSSLHVSMLRGKIDFGTHYSSINHYHYERHLEDKPEAVEFLRKVLNVIQEAHPRREISYDSDYGSIPNYYLNISVGTYEKSYELIGGKK